MTRGIWSLALAAILIPGAWTGWARADVDFGVRGGVAALEQEDDEADALVGVELVTRLGRTQWYFNPNSEVVFAGLGNVVSVNGDVHYDFYTTRDVTLWAGGGPAFLMRNVDEGDVPTPGDEVDETAVGLNVLGGVGFNPDGGVRPYVQGKVVVADESSGSVAFGLRF